MNATEAQRRRIAQLMLTPYVREFTVQPSADLPEELWVDFHCLTGIINCVLSTDGKLTAYNTDGSIIKYFSDD